MMMYVGVVIGGSLGMLIISLLVLPAIKERNDLLDLCRAVIKEHEFTGHPIADSSALQAMREYMSRRQSPPPA